MKPVDQWRPGDTLGVDHIAFASDLEQKIGMLEDDVRNADERTMQTEIAWDEYSARFVDRVRQIASLINEQIGPWSEDESWSVHEIRSLLRDLQEEVER